MYEIEKRTKLIQELVKLKDNIEEAVREAQAAKMALELLPKNTPEYEEEDSRFTTYAKSNLVYAIREYEKKRNELKEHCSFYHLSGSNFESALYWVEFFCICKE